MAAPNVRNVAFWPARLIQNPTDLSLSPPYGGTYLGLTRAHLWAPRWTVTESHAEEYGGTIDDVTYDGEIPVFRAVLREFDPDAIKAIFPNYVTGSVTGKVGIRYHPGDSAQNRPGYSMGNKAFKLLVAPLDETQPFLLLWRAIPRVDEAAEVQFKLRNEAGIAVVFHAGVDAQGRCYNWQHKEDLSLI